MNNEAVLNLLSNLSTVFTVLCVFFLIASVAMFFALDIKSAVLQLSGKTKAEETKRMRETYALTGMLREGVSAIPAEPSSKQQSETTGLFLTRKLNVPDGQPEKQNRREEGPKAEYRRMERLENYVFRINKEIIRVGTEETID